MDSMDLVGKKILVIHNNKWLPKGEQCFTSVIVGCDPEIGICVAELGDENNPWFVYSGPLDPEFKNCIWKEHALEINQFCLNQLRSGYLSLYALDDFTYKLTDSIGNSGNITICPYSA